MSGKVGTFILGAAFIGAAFIPGLGAIAGISLKAAFLSLGASLVTNTVFGPSGLRSRQGAILQMAPDPQAPLPVVYGRTKLGLRLVDLRTSGPKNEELWIVGALCHGSDDGQGIAGIDEVYFDDRLAITPDGTIQEPFAGKMTYFKFHGGDTQVVAAHSIGGTSLNAQFPEAWPTTSNGVGVAGLVLKLIYDPELFATGIPNITAIVRGSKVQDPANLAAANAYSTNPARCIYNYLRSARFGLGATAAELDAPGFATMAAYYDTVVEKDSDAGTTGPLFACNGWVDVGQSCQENIRQLTTSCRGFLVYEGGKYRLFTRRVVAPTAFALTEANIIGDWSFDLPGAAATPNSIRGVYLEPANGFVVASITAAEPIAVTTGEPHGFSTGQTVYLYKSGSDPSGLTPSPEGLFKITVTGATTFTLDATQAPTGSYTAGRLTATAEPFPWQADTRVWPRPGTSNGFLTADNNHEVIADADLPFTIDPYTAEQLIMVALRETRSGTTVGLTATEEALKLQVGDVVPVTHPTPGWVAKPFWVLGTFLVPETGRVRLALLEYEATAYTLDPLNTVPPRPTTRLPNPFQVAPPTDLILVAGNSQVRFDTDGSQRPFIRASWTASPDAYVDYYEVQYRVGGTGAWLPSTSASRTDLIDEIGPVSEGVAYDVRVRAVNTLGIASEWLQDEIVPQLTLFRSGAAWVDDFSAPTPGRRWRRVGGIGTFTNVYDPDASTSGSVGRATGPVWFELAENIPFDSDLLYVLKCRFRQLRDPVEGGAKTISIGLAGVAQTPGKTDAFTYVNRFGRDAADNQHYILVGSETFPAGREWQGVTAYIRGVAGGKVELLAAMLSASGLGSFSPANCVDGNTDPNQVGFHVNSAVSGAYLQFDLGVAKAITEARLHMAADGSTAEWELEFADSPSGPWTVAT